jgi:hypothetical protein
MIKELYSLANSSKAIYDHPLKVSNSAICANLCVTRMHRGMKDIVLSNTVEDHNSTLKSILENEAEVFMELDIIKEQILGEAGRTIELETRKLFNDWKPIRDEVLELIKNGQTDIAISITRGKGADQVQSIGILMTQLSEYANKKADGFLETGIMSKSKLKIFIIMMIVMSVILAFALMASYINSKRLNIALTEIKTLRGIIPICSYCKKIRDDKGAWDVLEKYLTENSHAKFSHGMCPDCLGDFVENVKDKNSKKSV